MASTSPRLDRAALRALLTGAPFVNVGDTVWVRQKRAYIGVGVADVGAADARIGLGDGKSCDSIAFGRCWVDWERRASFRWARRAGAIGAAALLAALLAVLMWRIRLGRRLMKERAFVLRLLTHELRTPVTALKLQIEGARTRFDDMAAAAAGLFPCDGRGGCSTPARR